MNWSRNVRSEASWSELYAGPWILTGNVAKLKVLHALHGLISKASTPSILDVGCVGLQPTEFWEPLLTSHASDFHLTGVDVRGIDRTRDIVTERGWGNCVTLKRGSGYNLSDLFAPGSFNVVVATQVLEHVAQLSLFMKQVATMLIPGGEAFFTVDSAHWKSRFDPWDPVRLTKNLIKKGLSLIGNETHYDLPWFDHEIAVACQNAGLNIIECRYYNLAPLKFIHNHIVPLNRKNTFMRVWYELEEFLNQEEMVREKTRHLFMGLYLRVRK